MKHTTCFLLAAGFLAASLLGGLAATLLAPAPVKAAPKLAQNESEEQTTIGLNSSKPLDLAQGVPVPGGPGFYPVSPHEFTAWTHNELPGIIHDDFIYNPGTTNVGYKAPLHLPNGASLTKMVVYYKDDSLERNIFVKLWKCPLMDIQCMLIGELVSSDALSEYRTMEDMTIYEPLIYLQSNTYRITMTLPPDITVGLLGIRIDYGYPLYVPSVQN